MRTSDIYKAVVNNIANSNWQDDAFTLLTEREAAAKLKKTKTRNNTEEEKTLHEIVPTPANFKENFSISEFWMNKDFKECLLLASNLTTVYRYQLTTSKLTHKIEIEAGDHLLCMVNINQFVTVNNQNMLKIWSFSEQECYLKSNRLHSTHIFKAVPYEDTFLTFAFNDKMIKRWDVHSISLQSELELPVMANDSCSISVCKNYMHLAIKKDIVNKNEKQNVIYKIEMEELKIVENYWDRNVVSSMQSYDEGRKNIYVKAGINVEAREGENKVIWSKYYGGQKLTCVISQMDSVVAVISDRKTMNIFSLNNFFNFGKVGIKVPGEIIDVCLNEHSSEFCIFVKVSGNKILLYTAPYRGKRFCLKKDLRSVNIKGYQITRDGKFIFVIYEMDPDIYCYELSSLKFCYKLENIHGEIEDLLIDRKGKYLYVATCYKVIYRWNLRKKKSDFFADEFKVKVEEVSVNKLSLSENGDFLAIADCSNKADICIYDLELRKISKDLTEFKRSLLKKNSQKAQKINSESIVWYNDQTLAVGWNSLDDKNIYFIDIRMDKIVKTIEIETEESDYFSFTSDKNYLVTCATVKDKLNDEDRSKVLVYETEKSTLLNELTFDMKIVGIGLGSDDRTLYLCLASKNQGLQSNKLVSWDLIDNREKQILLTNCLFDTPRLYLHDKERHIVLKSRKDLYILSKGKIKSLNQLDIASICLIKSLKDETKEEETLKELINHLYVNYPEPFAIYNFHLLTFLLKFDYKDLVTQYLNLYGYPAYDTFFDDPLYNCYSDSACKKQYILDIITYLNENMDETHIHEETLNKIFESNPSTKEQEFLTNCLFRYNFHEDCELEQDWLRVKSVGLPIGTSYYTTSFKEYPIEITLKKCGYSRTKLNLKNGSHQSLLLFEYLSKCSNDTISSDLMHLINYKWFILRWWYRGYSAALWLMTLFMCLNLVWFRGNVILIILNIILNILFIIFELKCFLKDPKSYFANGMNWVDCFIFLFDIVMAIVSSEENSRMVNYFVVNCVAILCMRAMTHLRIFDGTRYLIIMILQVFKDIFSFLVIYCFFVFAYAIVWLEASKLDEVEIDYKESLIVSTNLAFGDWDTEEYTSNQWIVFLFGSVTLTLIMLNFLIAIISETYERVNEDRLLNDLRAKIDIIVDFDQFLNFGDRSRFQKGNYFTIIADEEEKNPIIEKIEGVEEVIQILKHNSELIMERLEIGNVLMKKKFEFTEKQLLESFKKERQLLLEKLEDNEHKFNNKFRENQNKIQKKLEANQMKFKQEMSFLDKSMSQREEKLMGRFEKIENKMDDFLDELSDGESIEEYSTRRKGKKNVKSDFGY